MASMEEGRNLTGQNLFQLVKSYSAIGEHRTGTPGDKATIEWFASELANRGARVDQVSYRFQRYAAHYNLTANGSKINALPLFYEATGRVVSSAPHIAELPIDSNIDAPQLDTVLAHARESGAAVAILATTGAGGRLFALNRAPSLGSGFPALLVAGSTRQLLTEAGVHLELDASLVSAESATVVGFLGPRDVSPLVVVTTSLSGWFCCAGERGTGIAIALHLAEQLAERWPVMVVATTGHELHHLGLQHFLKHYRFQAAAVLHLGASVAAGIPGPDGLLAFAPTRWAQTTASEELARRMDEQLTDALLPVKAYPTLWRGEAKDWMPFGVPLMSWLGTFPLFHTPEDLPQCATSPSLLEIASDAICRSAHTFLDEVDID